MHRDELKPCPYCGGKPVAKVKKGTSRTSIPGFSGAQYFRGFVKCTECGVTTPLAKSPSAMNEAWNRRAALRSLGSAGVGSATASTGGDLDA